MTRAEKMKYEYPGHDGRKHIGTKNSDSTKSGRLLIRIAEIDAWFDASDLRAVG